MRYSLLSEMEISGKALNPKLFLLLCLQCFNGFHNSLDKYLLSPLSLDQFGLKSPPVGDFWCLMCACFVTMAESSVNAQAKVNG